MNFLGRKMLRSSSHLTARSARVFGFQISGASVSSANGLCKYIMFGNRLFKKIHHELKSNKGVSIANEMPLQSKTWPMGSGLWPRT